MYEPARAADTRSRRGSRLRVTRRQVVSCRAEAFTWCPGAVARTVVAAKRRRSGACQRARRLLRGLGSYGRRNARPEGAARTDERAKGAPRSCIRRAGAPFRFRPRRGPLRHLTTKAGGRRDGFGVVGSGLRGARRAWKNRTPQPTPQGTGRGQRGGSLRASYLDSSTRWIASANARPSSPWSLRPSGLARSRAASSPSASTARRCKYHTAPARWSSSPNT